MKNISIIAATISGNRGAEAMLTTTIGRIRERYKNCHFNVFSYYPKRDQTILNDPSITVYSATPLYLVGVLFPLSIALFILKLTPIKSLQSLIPASVRAINESDTFIDLAGVSFIDGREKFLPYNILTLTPAFLLKTPVLKFSQAMGPFKHRINRIFATHTLSFCKHIFARGEQTLAHLNEINLSNVYPEPVADVAFLHKQSDSLSQESEKELDAFLQNLNTHSAKTIGICPSSVLATKLKNQGEDYCTTISNLCSKLISSGHTIVLFPNATRFDQGESLRNNDLPVIKEIEKLLLKQKPSERNIFAVDFDINTHGIKQIIDRCDSVMVSRFHAMIAALSNQKPVMVIGWSHKYYEVMKSFNLEDMVFDFSDIDSNSAYPKMIQALDNATDISTEIASGYSKAQASSSQQFDYLFQLLDENQG
ncbi:MAG: polysaccharide pyruvyl transferase family protein [Candidatus Thiodiazotropha sp. L084R]